MIVQLLRTQRERAERFETAEETSVLILSIAENAISRTGPLVDGCKVKA